MTTPPQRKYSAQHCTKSKVLVSPASLRGKIELSYPGNGAATTGSDVVATANKRPVGAGLEIR